MITHIWLSTFFAGAAGLLTLLLKRNRARARYWVWLAGLVKFLVPFGLLVSLGGHINLPRWTPKAPAIVEPIISFATGGNIGDLSLMAVRAAPQTTNNPLPAILFSVWVCGLVAIAFYWVRRWMRLRGDVRAASLLPIEIGIPVVSSPTMCEPGVFGIFRPVLLLPEGMVQRLNAPELECILAHELCHVRFYDNLTAALYMGVQAIFWFHPMVWWLGNKLVTERELACDEEVLRLGSEPRVYADGILKVCELYLESPLKCVAGVAGSNLRRRIRAIMINRGTEKLNMCKKLTLVAMGVAALSAPIVFGMMGASIMVAQSEPTSAKPHFEVASIRPCENPGPPTPGVRGGSIGVSPGRLHVHCVSVGFMIQAAYVTFGGKVIAPISGGPAWITSDQFNIEAEAEGNPSAQMLQGPMLQALLEDRFKLKIHRGTREVPVYDLTVSKSGFKLQPIKEGSCTPFDVLNAQTNAQADLKATVADLSKSCGLGGIGPLTPKLTKMAEFHRMTLDDIAKQLSRAPTGLDRPVINKTGIAGLFDFQFEFSPEQIANAPGDTPVEPSGAPSIFAAIQQVAGLKLEPARGPGTFFVIDSAEKPSEN